MKSIIDYIIKKVNDTNNLYSGLISDELLNLCINKFKDMDYDKAVLLFDKALDDLVLERKNRDNTLEQAKEFYTGDVGDDVSTIKTLNIDEVEYDKLDSLLFHFSLKKNAKSISDKGIVPGIGRNSKGIDTEESVFFLYGVEGVLQLWDVWLKWRLNRLFNPTWDMNKKNNVDQMNDDEKKKYYTSIINFEKFITSGEYKKDKDLLNYLFSYQRLELLNSDYYSLDLIEGKDFSFDQIDYKKIKNQKNERVFNMQCALYGKYSDNGGSVVDKWNMNTIPGVDITIVPERITKFICSQGNDALTILLSLYDKYKDNVLEENQTRFDLLDEFILYEKNLKMDDSVILK